MRFLVAGWFSATAEGHYSVKSPCGKREALFFATKSSSSSSSKNPTFTRLRGQMGRLPTPPLSATLLALMNKQFFITTAIDYVNGQPRLGHA
jgi:hypothetical protein